LGRGDFSNIIKVSEGHIFYMESGRIKVVKKKTATLIFERIKSRIVKNDINNISSKELNSRLRKLRRNGSLDTTRARKIRSLAKPENNHKNGLRSQTKNTPTNSFESKIYSLLKENNIEFEIHKVIKAKNKSVVVDFVIPSAKAPLFIIEVKQSISKNTRSRYEIMKSYAITLDHKIRNLKLKNKGIKGVVVLSSKYNPIKKLSPYILSEFLDTDKVFIDSDINKLIPYLKSKI